MKTSRGFSLVEMMVALVIGLFVSLAAISTAKQFALVTGKASSANANQNNVLSSIVAIESAIGQAGLGLYNNGSSTCGYLDVAYANAVAVNKAPVIAARIARGGASDTYTGDMITIVYAETASATSILKSGTNQTTINTSAQVQSNGAVAANDFVLLSELNAAATCILRQVTAAAAAVDTNGKPVTNLLFGASAYNATGFSGEAAKTGYSVIPIGTKMIVYESWYAHKATNTLRKINLITGAESIIADGVIALRAQYGAMGASSLDQWIGTDDAAWAGIWDVLDPADSTDANRIKKIRAIRFSVLTRESFLQKVDSASCNSTTNPVVPMGWGASSVDISDIHNWRCYTYRVATRVVPLRNAIWGLGS